MSEVVVLSPDELRTIVREEVSRALEAHEPGRLTKEYYKLQEACELKGVSYDVVRKNRKLQPNYGKGHPVILGGHYGNMFTRQEVLDWLRLEEPDIDEREPA